MTIVKTESGSLYEIDQDNNRVRRLHGVNNPTPIFGKDGEWRVYDSISPITIGASILFVWKDAIPGYIMPATTTSRIIEIDPVIN